MSYPTPADPRSDTLQAQAARQDFLAALRQNLIDHFSEEELRTLCFDLGLDYENLPALGKAGKAREIVAGVERTGVMPQLLAYCRRKRPTVSWNGEPVLAVGDLSFRKEASPERTNPFFFGGKITDPTRFVGREQELRFITQRMSAAQMTSVGVVGDPRIGKSSLLYHLYQTYPQRVVDSGRFLISYVSLQDARVRTLAGFLQMISSALATARARHPGAATLPQWPAPCNDLAIFRQGLQTMADAGLRCILFLDEFEALLDAPKEFDDRFYDTLRAAMDDQVLMLVIASSRPLSYYGGRFRFVSRFFNLGNTLALEKLTEVEASKLVRLPSDVAGGQPALGVKDQELVRKLGGQHPFLLQMAAYFVYEAQVAGRDEAWVRAQFQRQAAEHRGFRVAAKRLATWLLLTAPAGIGRLAGWLGARQDEVRNRVVGALIVLIVILALTGVFPIQGLLRWITTALGLGGGQP